MKLTRALGGLTLCYHSNVWIFEVVLYCVNMKLQCNDFVKVIKNTESLNMVMISISIVYISCNNLLYSLNHSFTNEN